MKPVDICGALLGLTLVAGCVTSSTGKAPAPRPRGRAFTVTRIHADPRLMSECGIVEVSATFFVDIAFIKPPEGAVLKRIAHCLAVGPLEGRRVRLVDHAALRWPDRDHAEIGRMHVYAVRDYLVFHGVERASIDVAPAGEPIEGGAGIGERPHARSVEVRLVPLATP